MGSEKFRVVVADDHALVRGGLAQLVKLVEENVEIFETNDFGQTLEILSNTPMIDLLLLDLLMPGMEDQEGIDHICKKWPDIPVIVISAKENAAVIRNALSAGAMGYIPKTSSPEVMMSAIKLVLSGGVYVPPNILGAGLNSQGSFYGSDSISTINSSIEVSYNQLTDRQQEVLDLMAFGKSNKDIANNLGLTTGTVKMHISRIFKTLNVQNRTEAVAKFTQYKKDSRSN